MFDLHCDRCDRTYLVGPRSLRRLDNTPEGPVGLAACPEGHAVRVEFRRPGSRARAEQRSAVERLAG